MAYMKQNLDPVWLDDKNSALMVLDQTELPNETKVLCLKEQKDIWNAIHTLQVRGAPAIGIAAAMGLYLAAKAIDTNSYGVFEKELKAASAYLATARPTAVNLFWALERMEQAAFQQKEKSIAEIKKHLLQEAISIQEEDIQVCKAIGEYGLTLIKNGDGILTHCNAGQLATSKYGTALAPIHLGVERGMQFKVFTDETRPLLQGARLSAYELCIAGVDTTVICDNMAAAVMKNGWVQAVFVGCDRVAMNGDTANKIGTLGVAIMAKHFGIPFYVCAPTSTIDKKCKTGQDIVIEERPKEEVTEMWYQKPMAPSEAKVYNPAFDVTDHYLISGIITEYGIVKEPYSVSLHAIMNKKNND